MSNVSPNNGSLDESPDKDLDVAVLQSLALLTQGNQAEFIDHLCPPSEIRDWLKQASLREVQGMLLATLRCWQPKTTARLGVVAYSCQFSLPQVYPSARAM